MKDYRKEEKIVQAYTSAKNNEEIYEMDFNCAEVVELMQIAVKNLAIHDVSQQRELLEKLNETGVFKNSEEQIEMILGIVNY